MSDINGNHRSTEPDFLAKGFEEKRKRHEDVVKQSPRSSVEYMGLPDIERLEKARMILDFFAPLAGPSLRSTDPVPPMGHPFEVPTINPEVVDCTKIGYDSGKPAEGLAPRLPTPPSIKVWADRTEASERDQHTSPKYVGKIVFAPLVIDDGELMRRTFDEPHAVNDKDEASLLETKFAQELVRLIDAGIRELIDGKIDEKRRKMAAEVLARMNGTAHDRLSEPS